MFEEAYRQLVEFTRRYERERANARGGRRIAARLAMALLRAGLPMTTISLSHLKEVELSGRFTGRRGYFIKIRRPRGIMHDYLILEGELHEIGELARQARELYGSDESLVRSLEYELRRFRETYGLSVTPLDIYALKLWCVGYVDKLSVKYSVGRLRAVAEHILSRAALVQR